MKKNQIGKLLIIIPIAILAFLLLIRFFGPAMMVYAQDFSLTTPVALPESFGSPMERTGNAFGFLMDYILILASIVALPIIIIGIVIYRQGIREEKTAKK